LEPPVSACTPENLAHLGGLPPGWHALYRDLLEALPPLRVSYAKEKLGAMRVHAYRAPEEAYAIFDAFSQRSLKVCAACGRPGTLTASHGHYMTYCHVHAMERGYGPPPALKKDDDA
jgi:hypothetical protein